MRKVYFDHQATASVLPEVFEAMKPYWTEFFGSPSSMHQHGLRAREALDNARAQFAGLINAESPETIYFTSGGTESANLAVKGTAYANQRQGNHIVLTRIEHPSVVNSVAFLEKQGFVSTRVKVDAGGFVDPHAIRAAITEKTILICAHHANHDLGTIEPVAEIGKIANELGITFYVDALASGGWLPIDVQAMGAHLLSLSPHRFYGPKGAGVLYRNRRARLSPVIHGGIQEGGWRAGTENVPAIVGAGKAAEIARRRLSDRIAHTGKLQRRLWEGLKQRISYLKLNGPEPGPSRITTNLNISTEFIEGEGQLLLCDMHGIAVASGTGCVSKSVKISPVLEAIGLDHSLARGNLMLTLGEENTEDEVDYVVETMEKIVRKLRGMSPQWDEFQRGLIDSALSPRKQPISELSGGHQQREI